MTHPSTARSVIALAAASIVLGACTLSPLRTPEPTSTTQPTGTPEPTAAPTAEPAASPTPEPTPDPGDVPVFGAGELVATTTDGLRLRRLPGVDRQIVVQRLPTGSELVVEMGPIHVDGFGWYLVSRVDDEDPGRGWIAAGYDPDAFLASMGRATDPNPFLAAFAHVGPGEFGPVTLEDEHHGLRWMALDPDRSGCTLRVFLDRPSGEAVQAVASSIGIAPAPGELGSAFFVSQPELRGPLFVRVEGDCAWAITVMRLAA